MNDRYFIEHKLLPKMILGKDGSFLIQLIFHTKGKALVSLYENLHSDNKNYECPYSEDDFVISGHTLKDKEGNKFYYLQIDMPEPEFMPLCKSVIIAHDKQRESRRYITIERDNSVGYFICEWLKDGRHLLYKEYSKQDLHDLIMKK